MKKKIALLLAVLMLIQCAACAEDTPKIVVDTPGLDALNADDIAAYQSLSVQNKERAQRIGSTIEAYYLLGREDSRFLLEWINTRTVGTGQIKGSANTASVWHYTSVLSMVSKLQAIDADGQGAHYAALYPLLFVSMDHYKGSGEVIDYTATRRQTMYAVNRTGIKGSADISGANAVYDDQMWIIREMVYAYKLTGEENYLQTALSLTETCLDGWDTTLDSDGKEYGGICWGPGYWSKHTCSNAPIIKPLVELYEIFREEGRENAKYYLDWAEKIYDWTTRLNIGNGLYGDWVGSERTIEGEGAEAHLVTTSQSSDIDPNTYTYNTGAMISGGAVLYRVTGNTEYLQQAKESAKAAYHELGNPENGLVNYPIGPTNWFNLILLEGYIDLFPYDVDCRIYIDSMQKTLDYAYETHMTDEGLLPRDLVNGWNDESGADKEKNVMDQAAAVEMYAILAQLYDLFGE